MSDVAGGRKNENLNYELGAGAVAEEK